MARLAEQIAFAVGDRTVFLFPSLRAALRLARAYGTFDPLFRGIGEGSTTAISRVIGECVSQGALPDLFHVPGRSLASRVAELQPIALDLVLGLLGVDPDKPEPKNEKPGQPAEPITLVEQCEDLFGFATGILRWTPETAWNATPGEIMAAADFRSRIYAPKENPKAMKPHAELTKDQQAELFAAQLMSRFGNKPDAE